MPRRPFPSTINTDRLLLYALFAPRFEPWRDVFSAEECCRASAIMLRVARGAHSVLRDDQIDAGARLKRYMNQRTPAPAGVLRARRTEENRIAEYDPFILLVAKANARNWLNIHPQANRLSERTEP